jgi:hypothetical protein
MSSSSVEQIKIGAASSGVEPLILKRWSPRAFSDRSIDPGDLKEVTKEMQFLTESSMRLLVSISSGPPQLRCCS